MIVMKTTEYLKTMAVAAVMLIVAGCGGGGGGSVTTVPDAPSQNIDMVRVSGAVYAPDDQNLQRVAGRVAEASKVKGVEVAGASVTAALMNSDGSLEQLISSVATTDENGKYVIEIPGDPGTVIVVANKNMNVKGKIKTLYFKTLISLTEEDIASGGASGQDADAATTLAVQALAEVLVEANKGKSEKDKSKGKDVSPTLIDELIAEITAALEADQSGTPAVDLLDVLDPQTVALQSANLENSPNGAGVKNKKDKMATTGSLEVKVNVEGTGTSEGAVVTLYVNGTPFTETVDSSGSVIFDGVPVGADLDVEVVKAGYTMKGVSANIDNAASVKKIVVTLEPATENQAPVAIAGPDQNALAGTAVVLDGTGSYDPDGDAITYSWTQLSGPTVTLSDPAATKPAFTPSSDGTYVFGLVVNDGALNSAQDTVTITVLNMACSSDADCDDDADLTLDKCQNPGTTSAVCVHTGIVCIVDADCASSAPFCINGGMTTSACIICKASADCDDGDEYTVNTCNNAGTAGAFCSSADIACITATDCDDSDDYTKDSCVNAGTAQASCSYVPLSCLADADCDDGNSYTEDTCKNPGTLSSTCSNVEIACLSAADCADGDGYTLDTCTNAGTTAAACAYQSIACLSAMDCADGDDYTMDSCDNAGTPAAACSYQDIVCLTDIDCGDGSAYTEDSCDNAGTPQSSCSYQDIACLSAADCDDSNAYTEDSCGNAGTTAAACSYVDIACITSADCDDSNNYTVDTCNNGGTVQSSCSYQTITCFTATDCDDSDAYTKDTCNNGGTIASTCTYQDIACLTNTDCDDANAYTEDTCLKAGTTQASCTYAVITCLSSADCNDGLASTSDRCENAGTTSSACYNTLDNEWVNIATGEFIMGCTGCYDDEQPAHAVHLPSYDIQKYEVTNAQYSDCVAAGVCSAPVSASSSTAASYYGNHAYDDYPVIYVDWSRANSYCAWIGARLPTEAEWEKAAKGPTPEQKEYPWGAAVPTCSLSNGTILGTACVGDTTVVGSNTAGASYYGILDMSGNVAEWVYDWYNPVYYMSSPYNDPQGGDGSTGVKLIRGGGWNGDETSLRLLTRSVNLPTATNSYTGFRCAVDSL